MADQPIESKNVKLGMKTAVAIMIFLISIAVSFGVFISSIEVKNDVQDDQIKVMNSSVNKTKEELIDVQKKFIELQSDVKYIRESIDELKARSAR